MAILLLLLLLPLRPLDPRTRVHSLEHEPLRGARPTLGLTVLLPSLLMLALARITLVRSESGVRFHQIVGALIVRRNNRVA